MVKTESRKEAKVSARSAHSTNEDEDFTKSKMKESKSEDLSTTDINWSKIEHDKQEYTHLKSI